MPKAIPGKQAAVFVSRPALAREGHGELKTNAPRDIQVKHHGHLRNDDGHLPTTARALVLRNGKYGAMGTGELVLTKKISGREKLELLGGKRL